MLIWHGSGLAFRFTRPPNLENRQMLFNGSVEDVVFSNMGDGQFYTTIYLFYSEINRLLGLTEKIRLGTQKLS